MTCLLALLSTGCSTALKELPLSTPFLPQTAFSTTAGKENVSFVSTLASHPSALQISPRNTQIGFQGVAGPMTQSGSFENFDGSIIPPNRNGEGGQVDIQINMKSVRTKIGLLSMHLKSKDFFHVRRFPTSRFKSTSIVPTQTPGNYLVTGDLTVHGITQEVRFPAKIEFSDSTLNANFDFVVRQSEFGMEKAAQKTNDEVPVSVSSVIQLQIE